MKHLATVILCCAMAFAGHGTAASSKLGGDFTLTDHDGQSFSLSQLRGQVVMLFFGFTHCPDVCPTEMARMSQVLNDLGDQAEQVRGLLVTTDPVRDQPEVLKQYLGHFNARLIGLTGSAEDIAEVAQQYQVKVEMGGQADVDHAAMGHGSPAEHSTMDHSNMAHGANLFVIDQRGEVATIVPPGFPAAHVQRVVRKLLSDAPQ